MILFHILSWLTIRLWDWFCICLISPTNLIVIVESSWSMSDVTPAQLLAWDKYWVAAEARADVTGWYVIHSNIGYICIGFVSLLICIYVYDQYVWSVDMWSTTTSAIYMYRFCFLAFRQVTVLASQVPQLTSGSGNLTSRSPIAWPTWDTCFLSDWYCVVNLVDSGSEIWTVDL